MDVDVLYFAHVRERVGRPRETLTCADGATVRDVVAALVARHPALAPLVPHVRVAVDGAFAGPDDVVPPGVEVVLIPPVSGGAGEPPAPAAPPAVPRVALVDAPLGPETAGALAALVSGPACGAVVTFEGVVRDHARGRAVTRLHYEAYARMALGKLAEIADEVEARVPGARVAVHHRVGTLEVGEPAVLVVAASAHRGEAFDACRLLIDRLKEDVPIWKREIGPDGAEWVTDRP